MTRSEALEYFKEELKDGKCSDTCPICNAMEWAIKALAEPQPTFTTAGEPIFVTGMSIAKGKWSHPKRIHNVKHSTVWQCSICRRTCHCIGGVPRGEANICTYKFCPNCGAEMEISDD